MYTHTIESPLVAAYAQQGDELGAYVTAYGAGVRKEAEDKHRRERERELAQVIGTTGGRGHIYDFM